MIVKFIKNGRELKFEYFGNQETDGMVTFQNLYLSLKLNQKINVEIYESIKTPQKAKVKGTVIVKENSEM